MNPTGVAKNLLPPWRPGQSGNPGGNHKLPAELRAIKGLTQIEACRLISKFARMTVTELRAAKENKKLTAIEAYIVAIFETGIQNGDHAKLSFLLDRAIGKVPQIQETDEERSAREEIINLTNEELAKIVREELPKLEGAKG